ncbi:hypothetical protein Ahy_A05g023233 [Arachis hypogaea]|uniref:Uncharacterized protein n=1 Tax=Arachis hypogaea TaxID=3818 RepID=A0A445D2Z6_ARAHY|nr:hypothetical protein Ahy_A05g023233 [Arachis hypogaea]
MVNIIFFLITPPNPIFFHHHPQTHSSTVPSGHPSLPLRLSLLPCSLPPEQLPLQPPPSAAPQPHQLNLANLQLLNLAHNLLSDMLFGHITNFLWYLDLSSHTFSDDIPMNFFSKSQRQLINLSYNGFFGGISVTIGALKKFEHL